MGYIQFFLSFRCNRSCRFCFNRGISSGEEISPEAFRKICSVIKRYGFNELDILGGEPLLHRDLQEILGIASGYFESIYLSSNGTMPEGLKELKRFSPHIKIGISINSPVSKKLREYLLEERPIIKAVVDKNNFINKYAMEFVERGLPFYLIYRDILSEEELQDSMAFYKFIEGFEELKRRYPNIHPVSCEGFISKGSYRCPAGTKKLSVMPDGSVYPCYLFFRSKEFRLGNLLEDEMEEILHSPVLEQFKVFSDNPCSNRSCKLHCRCHGGCPAVSYILYGDINLPDPRCNTYSGDGRVERPY